MRQRVTSLRFLLSFALPHHSTHPSTAPPRLSSPSPLFSDPAVLAPSSIFSFQPSPLLAPFPPTPHRPHLFLAFARSSDKPFPRFTSFLSSPLRPSVPPFIRFSLSILLLFPPPSPPSAERPTPFPSLLPAFSCYPSSSFSPPLSTASYSLHQRTHLFSDSRYSLRFLSASSLPHPLPLCVLSSSSIVFPSLPLSLSLPPPIYLSIYPLLVLILPISLSCCASPHRLTHPRSPPPRAAPALFSSVSLRPRNLNRHRVVVHRHRYRVSRAGRAICCYHQLFASLLVVGGVAAAACCEQGGRKDGRVGGGGGGGGYIEGPQGDGHRGLTVGEGS